MKVSVTWMTSREYSAAIDTAKLLSCVTGTAYQAEARRLLSQIEAGPAVLPEDDQHWSSTGESEITHIQGMPTD
jgi:hypothetical protein